MRETLGRGGLWGKRSVGIFKGIIFKPDLKLENRLKKTLPLQG